MSEFLFAPEDGCHILMGHVGWDDEDEYYFVGDTAENDGHTLVRVQLIEGRDHTKPLAARAQGHRIVCHISSLAGLRVPPRDARVYIAIPKGMENVDGAGVIFACIDRTPARAGNINPDETVIVGPDGSEGRVIIKADGSVTAMTTAGNRSVVFSISPEGLSFTSPYGSMNFDATGFHLKTKYGPRIDMGGVNIPGLPGSISGALTGYCTITAPVIKNRGNLVYLGVGPNFNYVAGMTAAELALGLSAPMNPATHISASVRFSCP